MASAVSVMEYAFLRHHILFYNCCRALSSTTFKIQTDGQFVNLPILKENQMHCWYTKLIIMEHVYVYKSNCVIVTTKFLKNQKHENQAVRYCWYGAISESKKHLICQTKKQQKTFHSITKISLDIILIRISRCLCNNQTNIWCHFIHFLWLQLK